MTAHPANSLPRVFECRNGCRPLLRRLREDDAEEVCRLLPVCHTESDFLLYLQGEFDWTAEKEREYIRDRNGQAHAILLCAELDGPIIALAGAQQMPFRRYVHQAEIGITVARRYWGCGLGRTLTEFLVDWAAAEGLRKLTLRVFEDNHRAIKLYDSLGFIEEGRLRRDVLRADGRYSDTILMARNFPQSSGRQTVDFHG